MDSNHRPHDYQSCALASWAIGPYLVASSSLAAFSSVPSKLNNEKALLHLVLTLGHYRRNLVSSEVSLERRWSSRTFRYGYLVTTSPQLPDPPSAAPSLRLDYGLRVFPTIMVWRAVCTRPGNVFTAACWSAITSNYSFMQASCSLQSELRWLLGICSTSQYCFPLLATIVLRV